MIISALSYEQNVALAQFLEQNNLTEKTLYTALEKAKNEQKSAELLEAMKHNAETYCGKYFKYCNSCGTEIFYKVVAPYGINLESVSCIYFGLNPELDAICDYLGRITEVSLKDDVDFFTGTVYTKDLDNSEEINKEEFEEAFRTWCEKVLKLEWNV